MALIELTKGLLAMIDDEDLSKIKGYKWRAYKGKNDSTYYALGYKWANKKVNTVLMHRLIMSANEKNIVVDHHDHDGLNNTKENLRLATRTQNQINRKSSAKNSSSKYLGVMKVTHNKILKDKLYSYTYWQATLSINGKNKLLGLFKVEEDAARAYDKAAIENYGEFANPNFKDDGKKI